MITTMLGLIAFASAIERFFIRRATWPETILFWVAAAGLFWPEYWADGLGMAAFAIAVTMQKWASADRVSRLV
jgi:TRAP-type uncharacterized transport system fused permease subunit